MIKRYVKRPVEVQAVQWDGNNVNEIDEFVGIRNRTFFYDCAGVRQLVIHTLEGTHHASIGDYIIRETNGEFYPCSLDIFAQVYEEVRDTSNIRLAYCNEDRCVCCGRIIPEGQMVCDLCKRSYASDNDERRIDIS